MKIFCFIIAFIFFFSVSISIYSGRFMGSGQINHMGFPGFVILYDFEGRREIVRHDLHKV